MEPDDQRTRQLKLGDASSRPASRSGTVMVDFLFQTANQRANRRFCSTQAACIAARVNGPLATCRSRGPHSYGSTTLNGLPVRRHVGLVQKQEETRPPIVIPRNLVIEPSHLATGIEQSYSILRRVGRDRSSPRLAGATCALPSHSISLGEGNLMEEHLQSLRMLEAALDR